MAMGQRRTHGQQAWQPLARQRLRHPQAPPEQLAPIGTPGTPLQRTTDGSPLYRPQARRCQPTILVRQRPIIGTLGTPPQRTSLASVRRYCRQMCGRQAGQSLRRRWRQLRRQLAPRILAQLCPTIGTPGTPLQHTGLGRVRRLGATPQRRSLGRAVHGRGCLRRGTMRVGSPCGTSLCGTSMHRPQGGRKFQHASGLMTNALRRRRPLAPYIAIAVPKRPLPFQVTMWVAS